jgi:hypothetical protein
MTARLARMVVRLPRDLKITLSTIEDRLFSETRLVYSHAAIFRGLLALGLLAVAGVPRLAPLFVGTRIKRGRKKGDRRSTPLDLEHDDSPPVTRR